MAVKLGNGNWAVKEDKLLAYNDNSGLFFNKEFDFTRGSTATYVGRDGLIASAASGVPRIDFTNDTKGHLLLEPSRTNLITYSEDFTTDWSNLISGSGINPIVTSNQGTSPDGSLNADKVVFDLNGGTSSSDYSLLNYSLGGFSNPHTLDTSIYLKSSDGNDYQVAIYNRGTSIQIITVTNQWQRFSVNGIRNNTTNNFRIGLFGDNSSNTASLLLFGGQAELGSYTTSYIPTAGAASTRNADVCNNSGSAQDFNSEEGVLYVESAALANDGTNRWAAAISDGTNFERVQIIYLSTDNTISASVINNNTSQCSFSYSSGVATDFNKIAISYKQNDFKMYVNGTQVDSDTSGNAPSGLDTLGLERPTGVSQFYGKVRNVQVFTEALTDEQLEKLTS